MLRRTASRPHQHDGEDQPGEDLQPDLEMARASWRSTAAGDGMADLEDEQEAGEARWPAPRRAPPPRRPSAAAAATRRRAEGERGHAVAPQQPVEDGRRAEVSGDERGAPDQPAQHDDAERRRRHSAAGRAAGASSPRPRRAAASASATVSERCPAPWSGPARARQRPGGEGLEAEPCGEGVLLRARAGAASASPRVKPSATIAATRPKGMLRSKSEIRHHAHDEQRQRAGHGGAPHRGRPGARRGADCARGGPSRLPRARRPTAARRRGT